MNTVDVAKLRFFFRSWCSGAKIFYENLYVTAVFCTSYIATNLTNVAKAANFTYMAKLLKPPSTTATVPVTKREASLIR